MPGKITVTPHKSGQSLIITLEGSSDALHQRFKKECDRFKRVHALKDAVFGIRNGHALFRANSWPLDQSEAFRQHFQAWFDQVAPTECVQDVQPRTKRRLVIVPPPPPPQAKKNVRRHDSEEEEEEEKEEKETSEEESEEEEFREERRKRRQGQRGQRVTGIDRKKAHLRKRKRRKREHQGAEGLPPPPHSPTVVLTLRERWDPDALDLCLRTEDLGRALPELSSLDLQGYTTVRYGWTTQEGKRPCGRLMAIDPSAQNARGIARRLCQHKYYHDIDQVNSGPSIVRSLCQRLDIRCEHLTTYVQHRDQELEAVMATHSVSREQAKQAYQSIVNGSSLDSCKEDTSIPAADDRRLYELHREMYRIRETILASNLVLRAQREHSGLDELQLFARIVRDKEREALLVMMDFFESRGYPVGVLIHDGLHIERKQPGSNEPLDPQLLCDCEKAIWGHAQLRISLKDKSLEPTKEDWQYIKNTPHTLGNERDAAKEVALLRGDYLAHTTVGLAVFEPAYGTYSVDAQHNIATALPHLVGPLSHRFEGERHHFFHQVMPRRNLFEMMRTVVPVDHRWLEESSRLSRNKLCFTNGYWDFDANQFVEGSFPELRFMTGVRAPLMPRDEHWMNQVFNEVFTRPYSQPEVRDYVLKALARALAGDVSAKQGYFILGPSNSGKGMVTLLLEHALPGVVAQFDASVLCKESSSDPAKDLGWVVPLHTKRIIVANEFNMRTAAANQSASTTINAEGVTPCFTPFILANDMPEFDNPSDSGAQTRSVATYMDRHAVLNRDPQDESEFRADLELRNRILMPEYQNGLLYLLFDYHAKFKEEGHEMPAAIRHATAERIPKDGVWDTLADHYENWSSHEKATMNNTEAIQKGWHVRKDEVYKTIEDAGIVMSKIAIGAELKKRGVRPLPHRQHGQLFLGLRKLGAVQGDEGLFD